MLSVLCYIFLKIQNCFKLILRENNIEFLHYLKKASQSIDFSAYVPCKVAPVFKPEEVVTPVKKNRDQVARNLSHITNSNSTNEIARN